MSRRQRALSQNGLLDELPIAVLVIRDGAVVRVNDGWTELTGLSLADSRQQRWLRAIHEDDRRAAGALLEPPSETEPTQTYDFRLAGRNARDPVWVHVRSRVAPDVYPPTRVVTLSEVSRMSAADTDLRFRATHDEMTGLFNRSEFLDRVGGAVGQRSECGSGVVAVMFVDLDGFKSINDSHGHGVGDELLIALARRLHNAVRPTDTVARIGGDEFGILLPHVDSAIDAARVAARIVDVLAVPVAVGRHRFAIGVSVGIALSSGHADVSAAELVACADRAMYTAKGNGGSQWAFATNDDPAYLAVNAPGARFGS